MRDHRCCCQYNRQTVLTARYCGARPPMLLPVQWTDCTYSKVLRCETTDVVASTIDRLYLQQGTVVRDHRCCCQYNRQTVLTARYCGARPPTLLPVQQTDCTYSKVLRCETTDVVASTADRLYLQQGTAVRDHRRCCQYSRQTVLTARYCGARPPTLLPVQ